MSDDTGRKVLLLSVRCLVFLLAFFALWIALGPYYTRVLAAAFDALAPVLETPKLTESVAYDAASDSIVVTAPIVFSSPQHGFDGTFHFGSVLFAALVFATLPNLTLLVRSVLVFAGLLLLVPIHLAELHVFNQAWYAFYGEHAARSYTDGQRSFLNWTAQVLKHGEIAFPLILWVFAYFSTRRRGIGVR